MLMDVEGTQLYRKPFSQGAKRGRSNSLVSPIYSQPIYKAPSYRGSHTPRYFVSRTPGGNITSEIKYFDSQLVAGVIAAAGTTGAGCEADPATLNTLFAPTQGNDITNREARKAWVRKIAVKGYINCAAQVNQTAGDDGLVVRLALLCDKQTNSAQYNSEDLFLSGSGGDMINAFQNNAFFGRFQVYKDKYFHINPNMITWDGTNLEQQGSIIKFKMSKNFITQRASKGLLVNFNATNGGTVADIIDNSFHMYAAVSTATGQMPVTLSYKVRTAFTD